MISIVTILTMFIHLIGSLWIHQILAECFEKIARTSEVKGVPKKWDLTLLIPYSLPKHTYLSLFEHHLLPIHRSSPDEAYHSIDCKRRTDAGGEIKAERVGELRRSWGNVCVWNDVS